MRRSVLLRAFGLSIVFASAFTAGSTETVAARTSTMFAAPDFCQIIEDTGQLITIPWASQGCSGERESMRTRIASRNKFPGRYPPLTCLAGGKRYAWDSLSCTHARNRYAAGAIRPVYFGVRPNRAGPKNPPPAATPVPSAPGASPSPQPRST